MPKISSSDSENVPSKCGIRIANSSLVPSFQNTLNMFSSLRIPIIVMLGSPSSIRVHSKIGPKRNHQNQKRITSGKRWQPKRAEKKQVCQPTTPQRHIQCMSLVIVKHKMIDSSLKRLEWSEQIDPSSQEVFIKRLSLSLFPSLSQLSKRKTETVFIYLCNCL